jgi:hypothetical protein
VLLLERVGEEKKDKIPPRTLSVSLPLLLLLFFFFFFWGNPHSHCFVALLSNSGKWLVLVRVEEEREQRIVSDKNGEEHTGEEAAHVHSRSAHLARESSGRFSRRWFRCFSLRHALAPGSDSFVLFCFFSSSIFGFRQSCLLIWKLIGLVLWGGNLSRRMGSVRWYLEVR